MDIRKKPHPSLNKQLVRVAEARYLLNKLLMGFVLFTVLSLGIVTTSAEAISATAVQKDLTDGERLFLALLKAGERVTYTVGIGITYVSNLAVEALPEAYGAEVPVPFDYQHSGCTLVSNSTDYKRYLCDFEWTGENHLQEGEERTPAEDGCTSGFDIDIRTGECRPFEVIQEEARHECDIDPECGSGYYNPAIDPAIPLPDEDTERVDEQELIRKINQLIPEVNCYQGRGTTDGIQDVRDFPIPVHKVQKFVDGVKIETYELDLSTPSSPIQIRGYYATVVKAAFECHAQNTLLNDQGGVLSSQDRTVGYCDRFAESLTVEESIQAGCGMTSGSYYRSLHQDVPIMTQDMANQKANFGIEKSVIRDKHDPVCSHNYAEGLRKAYGCPGLEKPESGNGRPTELKDYHDNPVGEAAEQYKLDGGKAETEKLIKDAMAKKIKNLTDQILKLRASQK